ncbi:MAG: carboxymuconolactone decarboxylase family protein [Rhodobacteraceae bacterium]|nr:carboxymuconolactone decarboxylase family protein [Paracoccaceae bacterium]
MNPHDFSPIDDEHWPDSIADLKDGFAGRLNVYRTMAHHPGLLTAWASLRDHIVRNSALTPEQSEVVILRTGHRLNSAYEWAHHVSRARAKGMADHRINSIAGDPADMLADDAALTRAVDALLDHKQLSGPERQTLEELTGPQGVLDVMATVGFYSTLGFIVKTFDTPIETDLAVEPPLKS